jgi:diguanylate cyclase (GGDEF)-like protein
VALVLVDIDHFKLYNDHYGHQAGDATLVQFAAAMRRAAARTQDLVARYGGEEFAILLPQLDGRGATGVANRLMAELEHMAIPHAASPTAPRLTASMGIACMVPGEHSMPADLIQVADALLYQAKAEGRDRFRVGGVDCVA